MFFTIVAAGLHFLALGFGLGGLFARGLGFRDLRTVATADGKALRKLLLFDNLWGLAAVLWIGTGLWRVFGGVEKASDFYLHNGFFFLKMGLFLLVFALEIYPMYSLIVWRLKLQKGGEVKIPPKLMPLFIRINDIEMALVLLIPFAAAAMARGIWMLP